MRPQCFCGYCCNADSRRTEEDKSGTDQGVRGLLARPYGEQACRLHHLPAVRQTLRSLASNVTCKRCRFMRRNMRATARFCLSSDEHAQLVNTVAQLRQHSAPWQRTTEFCPVRQRAVRAGNLSQSAQSAAAGNTPPKKTCQDMFTQATFNFWQRKPHPDQRG